MVNLRMDLIGEDAVRFISEMKDIDTNAIEKRDLFLNGVDINIDDMGTLFISCPDEALSLNNELDEDNKFSYHNGAIEIRYSQEEQMSYNAHYDIEEYNNENMYVSSNEQRYIINELMFAA